MTAIAHLGNLVILAIGYGAACALLYLRSRWRRLLAPLGSAGRMPLSNYFLQSLVMTTLAFPYGFGLYGQLTRLEGVILAAVIVVLQVVLSRWWLARYRFGPVEWLWRTLSYARPQPMKVNEPLLGPGLGG